MRGHGPAGSLPRMTAGSLPWSLVLLALLVALPRLPGQDDSAPRRASPGRVVRGDGTPAALAEVVVWRVDGRERLEVRCDAQGRFRLMLQPTVRYVAWAAAIDPEHAFVSPLQHIGGGLLELRLEAVPQPALAMASVQGLFAWREFGPLQAKITADDLLLLPPTALDEQGRVPVPLLPAGLECHLDLLAGDGRLLGSDLWQPGTVCMMEPPQRMQGRVVDEQGRPIAGAVIERLVPRWAALPGPVAVRMRHERVAAAVTDGDGRAEWVVASRVDPLAGSRDDSYPHHCIASAAGRADSLSGVTKVVYHDGKLARDAATSRELLFTLRPAAAPQVRITGLPPGRAVSLTALASVTVPYAERTSTSVEVEHRLVAAADAAFALPCTNQKPHRTEYRLGELSPPLPADDAFARAIASVMLPIPWREDQQSIDCTHLGALRLQVLDTARGPADGACVLLSPLGGGRERAANSVQVRTDPSGRVALPILPGWWIVVAMAGSTFVAALSVLELEFAGDDLPVQTLQLEPLPQMSLRVLDAASKPRPAARWSVVRGSWGELDVPREAFLADLAWHLNSWHVQSARCDAGGRCRIALLPASGLQIEVVASDGELGAAPLRLEANDQPIEVTLR